MNKRTGRKLLARLYGRPENDRPSIGWSRGQERFQALGMNEHLGEKKAAVGAEIMVRLKRKKERLAMVTLLVLLNYFQRKSP